MFDLHENANATHLINMKPPKLPYLSKLSHWRSVCRTLVTGPDDLFIRRAPESEVRHFERIMHILLHVPNTLLASWGVFRQDREWRHPSEEAEHYDLVLRHARWNSSLDLVDRRDREPDARPHLRLLTRYIADEQVSPLVPDMQVLDAILVAGVAFQDWTLPKRSWSEIEVHRKLDWGVMQLTWSSWHQNAACEAALFTLMHTIEAVLERSQLAPEQVDTIEMRYETAPLDAIEELFPSQPPSPSLPSESDEQPEEELGA